MTGATVCGVRPAGSRLREEETSSAGLVGLAANLLICVTGSLAVTRSRRSDEVGVGA
ncbi:hypothetical protein [Pseudonocardia sp. ICBG1293]|uniref:hypothetical protein n=1 Tax=Pseudonocardia sp. ICBG1293 TaxID=2844382 RepID=UPI001CCA31BF|nr:hypothetical protein [Pseudonocardia sp. ICBG1293]